MTAQETTTLEQIVKASSERVDRVRRATTLLAVARGASYRQAARQAGFRSPSAVAGLVTRFNQHGLAALAITAGRGRKATYASAARAHIVARAQQAPDRATDGTATWSLKTLERSLRRQPAFHRLGATTIRRVLGDAGSSYQKTRTWCPTGTAERQRKSGIVTVTDPRTEEKRGPSSGRIGSPKRPASRSGARTRPGRIRPSPSRGPVGSRRGSRRATPTSISGVARPSC
jgi:transposase